MHQCFFYSVSLALVDLITPVLTSMHVYGEYGGIRGRWVDDRSKRTPADGTSELVPFICRQ